MKLVINRFKKTPLWCYIAAFLILMVAINIHVTSSVTEKVVSEKINSVPEMVIVDDSSFSDMQTYFSDRYDADASITYLLQPKDYVKLYKELVQTHSKNDSTIIHAPNRINLVKESKFQLELKRNEHVRITLDTEFENNKILSVNKDYNTIYVFPIYHYRTHVAEIMFLYKGDKHLSQDEIVSMTSELQVLSRYIK